MVKQLFILSFLFCLTTAFSQQKLRMADRHFAEFAYTEAAEEYEAYLAKEKNPTPEVLSHAADANFFIGKISAALRWYDKLYEAQGAAIDETHFSRYILALRAEELYTKADALQWQKLEAQGNELLKKRFITQKKHLDSLNGGTVKFEVKNLDINTNKADFGTAFYGNKLVYASGKDSIKGGGDTYSWNRQPYLSLYVSDRDTATGAFINEKKFLPNSQTEYHNAAPAFSPDFKTVYFSTNTVNKKDKLQNSVQGTNNIQLIKGKLLDGKLINPNGVPFNSKEYSVGQPAVSPDGKWLYFVSDMPGGYGATDIYVSQIFNDGALGDSKNLGPTVNTTGREMFPFLTGEALYFSSDGHYGLGGLDIFESKKLSEAAFSEPQNVGKPINSNGDDFAYISDKGGLFGYLSSNRAGGKGDDDIYYVTLIKEPCGQLITGRVINKKTGQPIAGVSVKAQVNGVSYTDDSKPDGSYSINIPCGKDVIVEATKPDHTKGKPNVKGEIELSEYSDLVKKEDNVEKIDINPIFFDFDQYYITPQAATELEKVVFVMQNFPNVVIKIESHTDSRGNDDYNMRLSDDRAKSTYSYIVSKGILPSRIESVKGYGESRLRNKCSNDVECTPEEHQLNRRSDFIIIIK
jgi:outer membrane protein OmpA-like peptidoglycan-associated protein